MIRRHSICWAVYHYLFAQSDAHFDDSNVQCDNSPMQSTPAAHSQNASRQATILLATVVLAGALLRFYQLGAQPLWMDEIFTGIFVTAQNSWAEVFERILTEPNPLNPFTYVVTHAVLLLFKENSVTLRLLAAFTGLLGVLAIYFVGQAYFNRRVGLIAALLLAIAPMHIFHSREARYYAPVVLFSLLTYYFLHRGLQSGQRKWWLGFTLVSILNIYTHLTTFLVLITQAVYAGFLSLEGFFTGQRRTEATIRFKDIFVPLSISLVVIGFSYLPLVPVAIGWVNGPQAIGNEGNPHGFEISANFFLQLYANFGAGLGLPLSVFVSACLIGMLLAWRREQRPTLFFLLMATLPFILILLARPKHFFAHKYVISLLPLYLIFIAGGIEYLASRITRTLSDWVQWPYLSLASLTVLTALFAGISLQRIQGGYNDEVDQWQAISTFLEANVRPGDAVAVLPTFLVTAQGDEILGYLDPLPQGMGISVPYTTAELSALLSQNERLWIVNEGLLIDPAEAEPLLVWLAGTPALTLSFDEDRHVHYLGKDMPFDALLDEASDFEFTDASLYASLGDLYASEERWEEGLVAYQQAFEMEPDQGIWHMRLGMFYDQMGDSVSAEAEYLTAIELQPDVAGFHAALADHYRLLGKRQDAIDHYTQALQLWRKQIIGRDTTPYSQLWQQHINDLQIGILP